MKKYKSVLKESNREVGEEGEAGIIFDIKGNTAFEYSPKETEKNLPWEDALKYCKKLKIAGKSDWFLPDKDQLNKMFILSRKRKKDFKRENYWSSTEEIARSAWFQSFNIGEEGYNGRSRPYVARAIRSFKI